MILFVSHSLELVASYKETKRNERKRLVGVQFSYRNE
jgi:hypothetical protein